MFIGDLKIQGIASLAPMAGFTDRAFREICALFGTSYFTSEMISAKGIIYKSKKTHELIAHGEPERPFALQLFGSCSEDFAQALNMLKKSIKDVDIIDINMGCPAPKITKENSGCALMKNPENCAQIVHAVKSNTDLPVTVKIRAGWNKNSLNAPEVARMCEEAGASAITIHGRTHEQMYSGECDLEIIKSVKSAVNIPVIGNGDVTSLESAQKMMSFTGCDMVAIGRGALGNPWIFSEINNSRSKSNIRNQPSAEEKTKIMKLHINKICEYKGETVGIKEAKKHIASYVKGVPNATELRAQTFAAQSKNEILAVCEKISATVQKFEPK